MSVSSVTNTSSTTNTTPNQTASGGALDENAFLTLLMTELQNQDPESPADDTQFISELAQFSSLQETTNVSTAVNNTQAVSMIGTTVNYTDPSNASNTLSGTVSGVSFTSNGPNLAILGSSGSTSQIPLSSVTGVD